MQTADAGGRVCHVAKQRVQTKQQRGLYFWVEMLTACRGCGYFFYVIILAARWETKAVAGMLLTVFISSCFLMSGGWEKPVHSYLIFQVCCIFAEMLTEE